MLDRSRDDVRCVLARTAQCTPHGRVDGLGARRGEHHLAGPGAEERRDLFASVFERDARRASLRVQPAGIGEVVAEVGEHRVERGRAQR